MRLMEVRVDDLGAIEVAFAQLMQDETVLSVLMLLPSGNQFDPTALDPILLEASKPVFGGIFAGVAHLDRLQFRGAILVGLPFTVAIKVVRQLNQEGAALLNSSLLEVLPLKAESAQTLFTFVDGLSANINQLIFSLFNEFGLEINYLGGGCGALDFKQIPCVITPQGVLQDAAVLALADCKSGVGVAHGWEPVSGAFKVTEVDGNRIISLDWQPAFDVYRQVVEEHSGERFSQSDFIALAKSYPFGIAKLADEMVIRDPIACDGGTLTCVGEVRRGAYVHIMHGEPASLIQAARYASELAKRSLGTKEPEMMLFVTCVSRYLFLQELFFAELRSVRADELPLIGVLSLGEIANCGQDYLELFNKTAVVGLL
ncbi:MAG: FIST signal transduction protein [Aeromonadaceae bacterium]